MKRSPARCLLFSPASLYPNPAAFLVDEHGTVLHSWSHPAHQPSAALRPPGYLRGWNHVEVDAAGNLFAIVPLRSLLKLTPQSQLIWASDIAAHHDLALDARGLIWALTEVPRRVSSAAGPHVVLDNRISTLDPDGCVQAELSLYDVLRSHPRLRRLIDASVEQRAERFRARGWPLACDRVPDEVAEETRTILRTGHFRGEARWALRRLRDLPGSPCDVLHTNTLELLDAHPRGVWARGDILLCMRELNVVAAIDPLRGAVRWWWGASELSGPHQPSALPDGRVLVFDNGTSSRCTRLLSVEPSTGEIVWSWSADPGESFFCPLAGGCERLANGNLLVTNSTLGRGFELTPDGRITWQLTLPANVYGADRGRASIYRMSAVEPEILARISAATCAPRRTEMGAPEYAASGAAAVGDRP